MAKIEKVVDAEEWEALLELEELAREVTRTQPGATITIAAVRRLDAIRARRAPTLRKKENHDA